jgi:hypothetical protein
MPRYGCLLTDDPCRLGNVELIGPEKGKAPPHDAATRAPELLEVWKERPGGGNRFTKLSGGLMRSDEIGNRGAGVSPLFLGPAGQPPPL